MRWLSNVGDFQRNHFHCPQSRAVSNAQRRFAFLVRRGFQKPENVLRRQHPRQLAGLVDKSQTPRRLRLVEGDLEEEAQRRDRCVHRRRIGASFGQMQLEGAQLICRGGIGRTLQKRRKLLDGADIFALRVGDEAANRHVFDHAGAQGADGLGVDGVKLIGNSCLEVEVL